MKKILFAIILILILYNTSIFSQNKKAIDSLFIYEINNNDFKLVLDSFIVNEMKYDYYDSTVMFSATIDTNKSKTIIQLFTYKNNKFEISKYDKELYGLIFHNKHYFLISTNSKNFDKNLLKKTNKKHFIKKIEPRKHSFYNKKTKKWVEDTRDYINDSYGTNWMYNYMNDKIYLVRKITGTYNLKEVKK